jgi:uncharacterized Fe-S center protein
MSSEDIKIHDPGSRDKEKQGYIQRDLENVLSTRQFRDWDDLLSFLREEGDNVRGVTPGELKQMVEDINRLKEQGAPFTTDAAELYKRARSG